jgi:uncharacterized membrane protein YfcA
MYNLYAFVKWCTIHSVRWVMTCPQRLHNFCIKYIEKDSTDTQDIVLASMIGFCGGTASFLLPSIISAKLFHLSISVFLLILSIPTWFILSVFIRAAYRKFRREQDKIFNTLKKDYRA